MVLRGGKKELTPEAFGKFLRWFSEDDVLSVREYQSVRMKLVRYFVHKGCADPDELFDRTVDIVVGKIDTCGNCPSPLAYCYGVAKNIWRQDLRDRKSGSPLDENIARPTHPETEIHEQELKCLEDCMNQLPLSDREVVIRYHQGQGREKIEIRRLLADELGGGNALRIKMCRHRKDLRICVANCVKKFAN
jgi:DNA-directed RNA polymerase specialized sigma24 family protein